MKSIIAIILGFLASLIIGASIVHVTVCHATGSSQNPYVAIDVSVHSVDDARGLNGHGDHVNDAWMPFVFDGVTYPGQNTGLFGSIIDENCSLIVPTPTPTITPSLTPTSTPTDTPTDTPSNTPTETLIPTDTPTNTMTPTKDPGSPTPTSTGTQPTQTPTYTPTSTPTETLTPTSTATQPTATSTLEPFPTPTPRPPVPAEALSIKNYQGMEIGTLYMDKKVFKLYEGINAQDGSLALPSAELGASRYNNVIWVHRAWNSGWVHLKVGDSVYITEDEFTYTYEVLSSSEIPYGIYPDSKGLYIATCMSNDGKTWTNVQLFSLKLVRIVSQRGK